MKNPFVYGEVVTGEDFTNRKEEIKQLTQDLRNCEKFFLISPRRYGKTSLIFNILEGLEEEGIYTIYLDLYKATSLQKLLELYTREISLTVEARVERAVRFIKDILPDLRPKITFNPDGSPSIGIDYSAKDQEVLKFLDEIYNLPQKLALKKNKNFVVVFDEFQEIRDFNGESIEKSMRASFQHHKNVGYLFAGSKKHVLNDMVYNENRPFYKIGKVVNLNKIPEKEFSEFVREKFQKTGFKIKNGAIEEILVLTENYPYNVQFLAHQLWDMKLDEKRVEKRDVAEALKRILLEQNPYYLSLWDSLTLPQRNVLRAIVNFRNEKIFSQEFIKENNLGPISTIQTSINLLIKKGILDKNNGNYTILDVFFKEWIKRETS